MNFSKLVVIFAVTMSAIAAQANSSDSFGRVDQGVNSAEVGTITTAEPAVAVTQPVQAQPVQQPTVLVPMQVQTQPVQQPATVVEAQTATQSKADEMRKQRENAEILTEQKLVEKLENSRLEDERKRAEKIFGSTELTNTNAVVGAAVQTSEIAPVQNAAVLSNMNVPAQDAAVLTNSNVLATPVIETAVEAPFEQQDVKPGLGPVEVSSEVGTSALESETFTPKVEKVEYFVSGLLGNLSYGAANMRSNYGIGVSAGAMLNDQLTVELGYFFSHHYVDTFWAYPVYRQIEQTDLSLAVKYNVMGNKNRLVPYLGISSTYIQREYRNRNRSGTIWYNYNNTSTAESSSSVNLGLLGGLNFLVIKDVNIGVGLEYSVNVMNTNPIAWRETYGLPEGTQEVEKINFYVLKVNTSYSF